MVEIRYVEVEVKTWWKFSNKKIVLKLARSDGQSVRHKLLKTLYKEESNKVLLTIQN